MHIENERGRLLYPKTVFINPVKSHTIMRPMLMNHFDDQYHETANKAQIAHIRC